MSRIATPAIESATGASAEVYAQVRKVDRGAAPDLFAVLGHLAPQSRAAGPAAGAHASGSLPWIRQWANWPFRVQSRDLRAGVVGRR
jgi:hypothetical protein